MEVFDDLGVNVVLWRRNGKRRSVIDGRYCPVIDF